jgi:hypothetical protein
MGMIVGNSILCAESAYEKVKELLRAQGREGVILMHSDEADAAVGAAFKDRAAFLGQGVTIQTTRVGGGTPKSMSGM